MKGMIEFPPDSNERLMALMVMDLLGPLSEKELKERLRSHLITINSRQESEDLMNDRMETFCDALSDAVMEATLYQMNGSIDLSILDEITKEVEEMERSDRYHKEVTEWCDRMDEKYGGDRP